MPRFSHCMLPFMTYKVVRVTELTGTTAVWLAKKRTILFGCCMKIQPSPLGTCSLLPMISFLAFNGKLTYSFCFVKEVDSHSQSTNNFHSMALYWIEGQKYQELYEFFFKPESPIVFHTTETFHENSKVLWLPRTKFYR